MKPWHIFWIILIPAIIWWAIGLRPWPPAPPAQSSLQWDIEVRMCDVVVPKFLTTDNMVELERSKFIIDRLNCDIAKRAGGYQ